MEIRKMMRDHCILEINQQTEYLTRPPFKSVCENVGALAGQKVDPTLYKTLHPRWSLCFVFSLRAVVCETIIEFMNKTKQTTNKQKSELDSFSCYYDV